MGIFTGQKDSYFSKVSGRPNHFLMKRELRRAQEEAHEIGGVKDMGDPSQFYSQSDTSLSVFFGSRGKGKTAAMTYFADFCKRRSERLMRQRGYSTFERRVFSNIYIQFAHRHSPTIYHDLQKFDEIKAERGSGGPMDFIGGILLMDEIADVAPAMRTNSGDSMGLSNALRMLRKLKLEMFACAQFPTELGRVSLRQVDFFIQPEIIRRRLTEDRETGKLRKTADLRTYWYNWNGTFTNKPRFGEKFPPHPDTADRTIVYPDLGRIWGKYNTDELVLSPHTKEGKRQLAAQKEADDRRDEIKGLFDANGRIPQSEFTEYAYESFGWEGADQVIAFANKLGLVYQKGKRGAGYFERG